VWSASRLPSQPVSSSRSHNARAGRDLVGLCRDHFAAQIIILAGRGDGGDEIEAAAVRSHFAIEHNQFVCRRRAAHLTLVLEQGPLAARLSGG
jgi:hypothetical protein